MVEEITETLSINAPIDNIDIKQLIEMIVVVNNNLERRIGDRKLMEGLSIIKFSEYGRLVLDHLIAHRGFTTKTIQAEYPELGDTTLLRIKKRLVGLGILFNVSKASDIGGKGRKFDIWLLRDADPKYAHSIREEHLKVLMKDREIREDFAHQELRAKRKAERAVEEAEERLRQGKIDAIFREFVEGYERTGLPPRIGHISSACRMRIGTYEESYEICLRLLDLEILPWIYLGNAPDRTWEPRSEWMSIIEASQALQSQLGAVRGEFVANP